MTVETDGRLGDGSLGSLRRRDVPWNVCTGECGECGKCGKCGEMVRGFVSLTE